MYAITAVMAYTLAVILERLYLFSRISSPPDNTLLLLKATQDHDKALTQLEGHPALSILKAGQAAQNTDQAWNTMIAEATLTEGHIRKRLASLATAGNIATMLGLLGTVYGLIFALDGLDQASAVERTAQAPKALQPP